MRALLRITTLITLIAFLVVADLHLSPNPAHACACLETSTKEELRRADAVFRGKVISIDRRNIEKDDGRGGPWYVGEDIVEFSASQIWKGEPYETIYVKSIWNRRMTSCGGGGPFFTDRDGYNEYLVFVYDDRAHTGLCALSAHVDHAQEELAELGDGERPIPGSVGPIPIRDSDISPTISVQTRVYIIPRSKTRTLTTDSPIDAAPVPPTPQPHIQPEALPPDATDSASPPEAVPPTPRTRVYTTTPRSKTRTFTTDSPIDTAPVPPTPQPHIQPEALPPDATDSASPPEADAQSGFGCGMSSGRASEPMDLAVLSLVAGLTWFQLRRRIP